jgi:mannose-6-phosphate isomerase-like protein (cupin superfamily)
MIPDLRSEPVTPATPSPGIQVVQIAKQPWYEADDKAVAREIASPRNSRAQTLSIADIIIPAGVAVKPHYHKVIEEIYYVTAGSGIMTLDGRETRIGVGDAVVIRPGERHSVRNDTAAELRLIVTCTPPWTPDCLVFD